MLHLSDRRILCRHFSCDDEVDSPCEDTEDGKDDAYEVVGHALLPHSISPRHEHHEQGSCYGESHTHHLDASDGLTEENGFENHDSNRSECRHKREIHRRGELQRLCRESLRDDKTQETTKENHPEVLTTYMLTWHECRHHPEDEGSKDTA